MQRQWTTFLVAFLLLTCAHPSFVRADLAVIVNPENPIPSLTSRQVKKIFMGKIRIFPRSNTEIMAIDQAVNEADRSLFYRKFIKMSEPSLHKYRASYMFSGKGRIPEELDGPSSVMRRVAKDKAAIAYVDVANIDESVKVIFTIPLTH